MIASKQLDATFAALADPTRRAILARLAGGEANVTELAGIDWQLPAERTPEISRDAIEALASPVFACGLLVFADGRLVSGLSTLRAPGVELLP